MNKRALITGITGNVGSACAYHLRAAGWLVTGLSRETGMDLADVNKVRTFAADLREGFDLLVVAHGVVEAHTFRDADLEEWERIVDGNLRTTFNVVNALLRWNLVKAGGLLVFCNDNQQRSYLEAIDPATGETAWRKDRPGLLHNWTTPMAWTNDGVDELVINVARVHLTWIESDVSFNFGILHMRRGIVPGRLLDLDPWHRDRIVPRFPLPLTPGPPRSIF